MYKYACAPDTFKVKLEKLKRHMHNIPDDKFRIIMETLRANTPSDIERIIK